MITAQVRSPAQASAMFRRLCLGTIALSTVLAGPAQAALLVYDPFAYGDNPAAGQYQLGDDSAGVGVIGGQNPTIGPTPFYLGAWVQSGGDAQAVKALPSLSYAGLQPGVGGVVQETIQFGCCSFGRSGRGFSVGLGDGPASRTLYQSFLINFGSQGTDDPAEFGVRGHELWDGGVGDSFIAVQLYLNAFAGVNVLSLGVHTDSGSSVVPVAGAGTLAAMAVPNNGTHLVVMKYQFNFGSPDVVSVYFDATAGVEPGVASAQISVATSDLFITHQGAFTNFTFSGNGHIPGAIDEIRWGDTFADVTPVSEPASLALCVAALLGMRLASARRRAAAAVRPL